jgi:hypothetical protein
MFAVEAEHVASRVVTGAKDQKPPSGKTAKPGNFMDHLLND